MVRPTRAARPGRRAGARPRRAHPTSSRAPSRVRARREARATHTQRAGWSRRLAPPVPINGRARPRRAADPVPPTGAARPGPRGPRPSRARDPGPRAEPGPARVRKRAAHTQRAGWSRRLAPPVRVVGRGLDRAEPADPVPRAEPGPARARQRAPPTHSARDGPADSALPVRIDGRDRDRAGPARPRREWCDPAGPARPARCGESLRTGRPERSPAGPDRPAPPHSLAYAVRPGKASGDLAGPARPARCSESLRSVGPSRPPAVSASATSATLADVTRSRRCRASATRQGLRGPANPLGSGPPERTSPDHLASSLPVLSTRSRPRRGRCDLAGSARPARCREPLRSGRPRGRRRVTWRRPARLPPPSLPHPGSACRTHTVRHAGGCAARDSVVCRHPSRPPRRTAPWTCDRSCRSEPSPPAARRRRLQRVTQPAPRTMRARYVGNPATRLLVPWFTRPSGAAAAPGACARYRQSDRPRRAVTARGAPSPPAARRHRPRHPTQTVLRTGTARHPAGRVAGVRTPGGGAGR
jgi:hypothetical protein